MKITENVKKQGIFYQVFNGKCIGIGLTVESANRDAEKNAEILTQDTNSNFVNFIREYALK